MRSLPILFLASSMATTLVAFQGCAASIDDDDPDDEDCATRYADGEIEAVRFIVTNHRSTPVFVPLENSCRVAIGPKIVARGGEVFEAGAFCGLTCGEMIEEDLGCVTGACGPALIEIPAGATYESVWQGGRYEPDKIIEACASDEIVEGAPGSVAVGEACERRIRVPNGLYAARLTIFGAADCGGETCDCAYEPYAGTFCQLTTDASGSDQETIDTLFNLPHTGVVEIDIH